VFSPCIDSSITALPSRAADPSEREQLSQAARFAKGQSESRAKRKFFLFQLVGCYAGGWKGRQKGLVDHVCPATFSYSAIDRKEPLTIVT
jgi:hypothetical protein